MIAYHLKPRGGFHFGREGLAQEKAAEVFPSDSFFSALLIQRNRLLGDDIESYCAQFPHEGSDNQQPPLRLSSVFPMIGDLPLFPKPLVNELPELNAQERTESDVQQGKALKKIAYVSPVILSRLLQGESLKKVVKDGRLLQNKTILISKQEKVPAHDTFWSTKPVPRVSIDRVYNASNIYQVARTVFAEDCGLWFMAEVADTTTFEQVLHALGDGGMGGDRTSGYGGFEPETMNLPNLPTIANVPYAMTLSRYNPTRKEIDAGVLDDGACYELVDVGGYLATNNVKGQRRQRVRMIEAGSILNVANITPTGRLVDVCPVKTADAPSEAPDPPDHPVYRSGIALLVGAATRRTS